MTWTRKDTHHFDLECKSPRWKVTISAYADSRPQRASINLWLMRQEHEYNMIAIVEDRPIISWSQVPFDNVEQLKDRAMELVLCFISRLGWI
jgi:hypothetical protein